MTDGNDKYDDEDTTSKRESHFNQQRSSLRSDKSDSILRAPSRPDSRQRLDDFSLNVDTKAYTDRADSETLPSPSSPAPNVPFTRSGKSSIAKGKGRSRAYSSRGRSKSTPDETQRLEELLAPESWQNPYELLAQPNIHLQDLRAKGGNASNPPSRGSRTQQRSSRQPSFLNRLDPRAETPGSQLDITALPSMTAATSKPSFGDTPAPPARRKSRIATEIYTVSHLIFFAILGTLARLGLQALTFYPGAPVAFAVLWANVAGTFIIGFLSEDRRLFYAEWGRNDVSEDEERVPEPPDRPTESEKKRHAKAKKTIPLYIGLATGFCGSFTSFSSFIRDVFLALSNDLRSPISHPYPQSVAVPSPSLTLSRNGGYSFLALLAVIIVTISVCYAALHVGAHLALLLDPITPVLPFHLMRRFIDPLVVLLGWGCWIGAIIMTIFPPEGRDSWRGQALYALVFAPLGCLARYYISLYLNPILPSFPLGTFTVNIFGTAVLGMAYDLQRVPLLSSEVAGGSVIGCQVLQGIMDGFCGCLTTVSTWMLELDTLRKRHAYVYGAASVSVGLGIAVAIMGGVRWSVGWEEIACTV